MSLPNRRLPVAAMEPGEQLSWEMIAGYLRSASESDLHALSRVLFDAVKESDLAGRIREVGVLVAFLPMSEVNRRINLLAELEEDEP